MAGCCVLSEQCVNMLGLTFLSLVCACCCRSVMTGNLSPAHHTKWTDALDDSLAAYLDTTRAGSK